MQFNSSTKRTFQDLKKLSNKEAQDFKKKINIAVMGEASTQFLKTAIQGEMAFRQLGCNIYEADYNQIDLEIYDLNSKLYDFKPKYVIIVLSTEMYKSNFFKTDQDLRPNFANKNSKEIQDKIQFLSKNLNTRIILLNLAEEVDLVYGNYSNKIAHSLLYQIRKFNYELMNVAQSENAMYICDINLIKLEIGQTIFFDNRLYVQADMIYSIEALPYISKSIIDVLSSMEGNFKKCLILDLDNTIWGGIIGDDGLEGIQIGNLGIGKAFTAFQTWAKELNRRGIIICICSKNNEEIAKEPFLSHPEMILKLEDISVFVANWENKADNIRHIQQVLNIGFNSMVFLDDNPFERNLVKQQISEITVPELPDDPVNYLSFLKKLNLFETASHSNEDSSRAQKYQEEANRINFKKTFTSIDKYLKSLKMSATIGHFDKFNVPRIAQLSQRSNQFNLRTIRYTENDISKLVCSKKHLTFYCKLKDKYGDYGLISIIILTKQNKSLFIDTWIMSCRVLKRDVEKLMLNNIIKTAKDLKYEQIIGEYIPSKKNIIVANHYKNLNFKSDNNRWVININEYLVFKTHIRSKRT
jgi:FkbH-like protein